MRNEMRTLDTIYEKKNKLFCKIFYEEYSCYIFLLPLYRMTKSPTLQYRLPKLGTVAYNKMGLDGKIRNGCK